MLELREADLAIELTGFEQLVMRTQARHGAVAQHADHVGATHRGNALRNDNRRERQPSTRTPFLAAAPHRMAQRGICLEVEC